MTEKAFNEAKGILARIERINKFRSDLYYNPYIVRDKDERNGSYLSLIDDKDNTLRNLITDWCNKEQEKLRKEMEEL